MGSTRLFDMYMCIQTAIMEGLREFLLAIGYDMSHRTSFTDLPVNVIKFCCQDTSSVQFFERSVVFIDILLVPVYFIIVLADDCEGSVLLLY